MSPAILMGLFNGFVIGLLLLHLKKRYNESIKITNLEAIVSNDGLGGYNAWVDDVYRITTHGKTKEQVVEELVSRVKRDGLNVKVKDLT